MLTELSIRNFAIIDDLAITFSGGLTILSGETGAGKSIIINAVNLLLGGRANAEMIRSGAEAAELEALFEIDPQGTAANLLKEQGMNPADGLLVRRIISRHDRHRVYINGRLSTMTLLSRLTANLASISGQHAGQRLLQEDQHLFLLDQFGGLSAEQAALADCYHTIVPQIKQLENLEKQKSQHREQMELYRFQKKEIEEAELTAGEDEGLERKITRLKNAGKLQAAVQSGIDVLYSGQGAVVEKLVDIKREIETASAIDPQLQPTATAIDNAALIVEDLASELRTYLASLDTDDTRLEMLEERLYHIRKLIRKYGGTIADTIDYLDHIGRRIDAGGNLAETIQQKKEDLEKNHRELVCAARALSKKRREAAGKMARLVEKELTALKMPHTQFELAFSTVPATETTPVWLRDEKAIVGETGRDQVTFMISPNVGEEIKPLSGIASGGELSRIVLAIKAILAGNASLETVVFDEVDAGIGGGVADRVGLKLANLSRHHQIICITHLPQIARFGRQHYRICKKIHGNRTTTVIEKLDEAARVREIARMLGGEAITDTTMEHAREMLGQAFAAPA